VRRATVSTFRKIAANAAGGDVGTVGTHRICVAPIPCRTQSAAHFRSGGQLTDGADVARLREVTH
jgi:hypothetical protein